MINLYSNLIVARLHSERHILFIEFFVYLINTFEFSIDCAACENVY